MGIEKILKTKWEYEWERKLNFFIADNISFAFSSIGSQFVYPLKNILLVGLGNHTARLYYNKDEIDNNSKRSLDRFINKKLLRSWIKECLKDNDRLKKYIFKFLINYDFSLLSNKELLGVFNEYYSIYTKSVRHIIIPRVLNRELQRRLQFYFFSDFKQQDKAAEVLNILTTSDRLSFDTLEKIKFFKLSDKIRKNRIKDYGKLLDAHVRKYAFIPVGYLDEKEWDRKYFENRLDEILVSKIDTRSYVNRILSNNRSLRERKRQLIRRYGIPKNIVYICNIVAWGAYFKDLIRERLNMGHYYSQPLFYEIAARTGHSFKEVKSLGLEDMRGLIMGQSNFESLINKRKGPYVIWMDNKKVTKIHDQIFVNKIIKYVKSKEKADCVAGIGVSLGKAEGRVSIIKKQSDKITGENSVLITTMTTPELVAQMKKVVAVVTDEGGMTCHAAIISRELGIPCIVGTKIATQVFKDGDLVEVDANNGIVRKVNR